MNLDFSQLLPQVDLGARLAANQRVFLNVPWRSCSTGIRTASDFHPINIGYSLLNDRGQVRLPDVNERELMLGFPLDYTAACCGKADRKKTTVTDTRLTLLGNTCSVPVVAFLLSQLFARFWWISAMSLQAQFWTLVVRGLRPWFKEGSAVYHSILDANYLS